MYGKHPAAMIISEDKAVRKVIRVVFPNASHRLCSYIDLCQFERFESEWKTLIKNHGVSDNKKVYAMKIMYTHEFFCVCDI